MKAEEYREICSTENAFRVSELEETLFVLRRDEAKEASVIESALKSGRLEKPELHSGQRADDFCLVKCTFDQADKIVDSLFEAEASSVSATEETTAITSRLADLVNRWSKFRETL